MLVERHCSVPAVRKCVDELRRREAMLSLPTDESTDSPNRYRMLLTKLSSV